MGASRRHYGPCRGNGRSAGVWHLCVFLFFFILVECLLLFSLSFSSRCRFNLAAVRLMMGLVSESRQRCWHFSGVHAERRHRQRTHSQKKRGGGGCPSIEMAAALPPLLPSGKADSISPHGRAVSLLFFCAFVIIVVVVLLSLSPPTSYKRS